MHTSRVSSQYVLALRIFDDPTDSLPCDVTVQEAQFFDKREQS
jgi:hypothetical protein